MGSFEDITSNLPDLSAVSSTVFDDVTPDDIIQAADADGDTLTVAYFVRNLGEEDGAVAGFYIQTSPNGCAISIEAGEALWEFLEDRINRAEQAGLA